MPRITGKSFNLLLHSSSSCKKVCPRIIEGINPPRKGEYPGVDSILSKVNTLFIYTLAWFPNVYIYSTSQNITQTCFFFIFHI